jgi:hypothetical protein
VLRGRKAVGVSDAAGPQRTESLSLVCGRPGYDEAIAVGDLVDDVIRSVSIAARRGYEAFAQLASVVLPACWGHEGTSVPIVVLAGVTSR